MSLALKLLWVEEQSFYTFIYKIEVQLIHVLKSDVLVSLSYSPTASMRWKCSHHQYILSACMLHCIGYLHCYSLYHGILSPVMHFTTMMPAYNELAAYLYRSRLQ